MMKRERMERMFALRKFFTANRLFFPVTLAAIELYAVITLIVPFLLDNNLTVWDMMGHYFSAWYLKTYLLPLPMGWNPFFFLGYPQNYFYPPLYSYLAAALGTLIGVEIAFKLVLVAVILLTPVSFYYCARKFSFSRLRSTIVMLAMYAVLFAVPADEHLGGNMHATFNVGLVSNALALMLLFVYMGKLNEAFKTKKYIAPSVLLTLIILSHLFTAIVAVIAFAAFAIASIRDSGGFLFGVKHAALTGGLSAFWIVPFLVNIGYARAMQIGYSFIPYMWLLFILSGLYIVLVLARNDRAMLPVALFVLLLLGFLFIGDSILHIQLHFYRFQLFLYLIVPLIAVSLLRRRDKPLLLLIVIASMLILAGVRGIHPEGALNLPIFYTIPHYTDGRMLIIASPGNQPSPHIYQHLVPLKSGNYGVKGLFVESSPNARYIFDMEKELDSYSLVWGSRIDPEAAHANYSVTQKQLELFNINYVFSFYSADASWKKLKRITFFNNLVDGKIRRYFYDVYKVADSRLVEVLNYTPRAVTKNWEQEVSTWFMTADRNVLVNGQVPQFAGTGNETVDMLEISERQDRLKFRVNSPVPVPVLIKISAFPNWKATENGKNIRIYRASPYLMLVYGTGIIEMAFVPTVWEIIATVVSVFSLAAILWRLYGRGGSRQWAYLKRWKK